MNIDAITLLADNLGALPGRDGQLLQFIQYSALPGSTEQQKQATHSINRIVAEAIVRLLTEHGYTITGQDSPHA